MPSGKIAELERLITEARAELARLRAAPRERDRAAQMEKLLGTLAKLSAQRTRLMTHQFSN